MYTNKLHRDRIHLDAYNRKRGMKCLEALYGPKRAANLFTNRGKDFEWLTKDVVYGMFYARDVTMDSKATALITYVAILCQGLSVQDHLGAC